MQVDDPSPTTTDSSRSSLNREVIQVDGIDIHTEHLKRSDLLAQLTSLVAQYRFVRLTSPASSGKTSLLKLYQHSLRKTKTIWISCLSNESAFELLTNRGINLNKGLCGKNLEKRTTVVFLDDAQAKYEDTSFWELLIKSSPNWLPRNIRFVISSTHLLHGERASSPMVLEGLPRLERNDFLLTLQESNEFLELSVVGLPQKMKSEILKDVLVKECGGLIGALRQSIDSLKDRFAKDPEPHESALLQYFLSNDLLVRISRCFGTAHSAPIGNDLKTHLKEILGNDRTPIVRTWTYLQDEDVYSRLKQGGILVEFPDDSIRFTSQLAKRYYFKWIFPNRTITAPASLLELIKKVIANMSASVLKKATMPGDFPKEAVFQQLFMQGLASNTCTDCSICPELSKIFPEESSDDVTQEKIAGEIDFYLNGNLRWGIELLVNGVGIGEHMSRFSPPNGKYAALAVNDYAVVDFRRNSTGLPTNISKFPKRVSVFFKSGDYTIARCIFGEDTAVIDIRLSD